MRASCCRSALCIALSALAISSPGYAQDEPKSALPPRRSAAVAPASAAALAQDEPVEAFTPGELLDLVRSGRQNIIIRDHIDLSASEEGSWHSENTFIVPPGNVAIMVRARGPCIHHILPRH